MESRGKDKTCLQRSGVRPQQAASLAIGSRYGLMQFKSWKHWEFVDLHSEISITFILNHCDYSHVRNSRCLLTWWELYIWKVISALMSLSSLPVFCRQGSHCHPTSVWSSWEFSPLESQHPTHVKQGMVGCLYDRARGIINMQDNIPREADQLAI